MSLGPEEYDESYSERPMGSYEQPMSAVPNERTTLPGIFLIIVGVVNILAGGLGGFVGYGISQIPEEDFRKQLERDQPDNLKKIQGAGISVKELQNYYLYGFGIGGCVNCVVGFIVILGGIMLWTRRGYTLAVIGAILAAIPIVSVSACPCIFGMGIGIWALIVLFNADVKAAFH
jgi:hypothetical protein